MARHDGGPLVFISYAREDERAAQRVEQALQTDGYRVWRDVGSIGPGEEWAERVGRALRECSVVVLLLSPHSARSGMVHREVSRAAELRRPVFTLHITTTDPPEDLRLVIGWRQWIDARGDLDRGLHALGGAIARELSAPRRRTPSRLPAAVLLVVTVVVGVFVLTQVVDFPPGGGGTDGPDAPDVGDDRPTATACDGLRIDLVDLSDTTLSVTGDPLTLVTVDVRNDGPDQVRVPGVDSVTLLDGAGRALPIQLPPPPGVTRATLWFAPFELAGGTGRDLVIITAGGWRADRDLTRIDVAEIAQADNPFDTCDLTARLS